MTKMTIEEASMIGLVPRLMGIRPTMYYVQIQALREWGKANGQDITTRLHGLKEKEKIATAVVRCFKKHGYGRITRNLVARLGI